MLQDDRKVLQKVIDAKKQSLLVADFRLKDASQGYIEGGPGSQKINRLKARQRKLSDEVSALKRILTGTSY